jgi:hypothetical protein
MRQSAILGRYPSQSLFVCHCGISNKKIVFSQMQNLAAPPETTTTSGNNADVVDVSQGGTGASDAATTLRDAQGACRPSVVLLTLCIAFGGSTLFTLVCALMQHQLMSHNRSDNYQPLDSRKTLSLGLKH